MKLYHSPLSSNSRKVRVVAALLDIELELLNVDITKGEQRAPEFVAINPMSKVPVLIDGDLVLPESAAIMIYLADSKPGNSLYPRDPRMRAKINQWLFWAASHWSPAVAALAFEKVLKQRIFRAGEPDLAQVKRQENLIRSFAKVLDDQLARHDWIAGDTLTLADMAIAPSLASLVQLPLESYLHIQAWFQRIQKLPAWKADYIDPLLLKGL